VTRARRFLGPLTFACTLAFLAACAAEQEPRLGETSEDLTAVCNANVKGKGLIPTETDYLPHVVDCENGAAPTEALKAQAIVARTYLYFKMASSGSVTDGQGDQVYTCASTPSAAHKQAVADTSGIILQYKQTTIASFFVAGALAKAPTCKGGSDPSKTEQYVTYNDGKSGSGITQSTLGFVSPTNNENRGCLSQNGSSCLAGEGKTYLDILHFYYGADIEIVKATGPCVVATANDAGAQEGGSSGGGGGGDSGGGGSNNDAVAGDGAHGVSFNDANASNDGGCACGATRSRADLASAVLLGLATALFVRRRRST
jgi:hypothetical protein